MWYVERGCFGNEHSTYRTRPEKGADGSVLYGVLWYSGKHDICATGTTGKFVEEATGLKIDKCLAGMQGGEEQIASRVAYNEIDLVLFFRDPMSNSQYEPDVHAIARLCDMHNIPIATNSATAEMLILGLDRGDLDWRNIVNPKNKK